MVFVCLFILTVSKDLAILLSLSGSGLFYTFTTTIQAIPFFYSALVSISVFMALSTVFLPSINSPDNLPLSYSVLPILILPYWSIQLYISLAKSPSALI